MDNGTVSATTAAPDGGPQYLNWSLAAVDLRDEERGVVEGLGAAVVALWSDLPRDVQEMLFNAAAQGDRDKSAEGLRGHIARFLHDSGTRDSSATETVTPAGLPPRDALPLTEQAITPAGLPPRTDAPDRSPASNPRDL